MNDTLDFSYHDGLRQRIVGNLASFTARRQPEDGRKRAAVALVVLDDAGAGALVLTKRSPRLKTHSGQWALPGGRVDDGETVTRAVLRELSEEVALNLGPNDVLGELDDYPTRSGYLITPVVLWAGRGAAMRANPQEVASIHRVPFDELDRSDSPRFETIPESDNPVIQMLVWQSRIHAPTAAVLYQFREVCLHGRETRVEHLEQPVWAWR